MSGIFGIFNRDGKPVAPGLIEKMLEGMSYWLPDDLDTVVKGSAALGHVMLWNTPESKFEHLPRTQGYLTLSMDARLDNREELAAELSMSEIKIDQVPDSTFIFAAYRKWGTDCPCHLLGDFAFALWDEQKKILFCARDHIGIKPLYYHCSDQVFIFASDMRGVLSHPQVSRNLDEYSIVNYLHDIDDPGKTFFAAVQPLSPAGTVTVGGSELCFRNFWDIKESPEIPCATVREYADRLRDLLENAVQVRCRSAFPVASHLSGGLDSSAIAVLAARRLQKKGKELRTYNWIHPPGPGDDAEHFEWNYSHLLASRERMSHAFVELTSDQLAKFYGQHNIAFNDRQYIWYEHVVRSNAAKHGVRTVLSGWGGDELISYNGDAVYTGLFWSGHPFKALSGLVQESRGSENFSRRFLGKCYRELFLPRLPDGLHSCSFNTSLPEWDVLRCVNTESSARMRTVKTAEKKCSRMSAAGQQSDLFHLGHLQNRIDSWSASAFADRIEYRYPLLDKRIVEFAMGIPAELYRRNGHGRYLFRCAVKDVLPATISQGIAKEEPVRVERLYTLMYEAQNKWSKVALKGTPIIREEKLISRDKIIRYIDDSKQCWKFEDPEQRLERLLVIHRSIMVWKLVNTVF